VTLAAAQNKDSHDNQQFMHIHNLYADENGDTHFRDINAEPATEGPDGKTSKRLPATGIIFRTTEGSYHYDWHTASRRQYVINLDAAVKVTASDGEARVIAPGEILLNRRYLRQGPHLAGCRRQISSFGLRHARLS
jgi:hypothetical protein